MGCEASGAAMVAAEALDDGMSLGGFDWHAAAGMNSMHADSTTPASSSADLNPKSPS
jgi:hypothetical protein